MSSGSSDGRVLGEALRAPPPGALLTLVLSVFLCWVYVLLGVFELGASRPLVSAGWALLGVAHLAVAYGLGKGRRWGWKLGVAVYGLHLVVVLLSPYGDGDPRVAGVFGLVVLYLAIRRDAVWTKTDIGATG